jgi:hypothetical protein
MTKGLCENVRECSYTQMGRLGYKLVFLWLVLIRLLFYLQEEGRFYEASGALVPKASTENPKSPGSSTVASSNVENRCSCLCYLEGRSCLGVHERHSFPFP